MTDAASVNWGPWTPTGYMSAEVAGPDGRKLRLLAAQPDGAPPETGWPCLVVLDGGGFFPAMAATAQALAGRTSKTGVQPMIVVGVEHQREEGPIEGQRARDYTSTPCPEPDGAGQYGGGPMFRDILVRSILPMLKARHPIDPERLTLFGHSLAGLFVLETIEADAGLFSGWVSVSPSLWWRTPEPGPADARLLVGVGEREEGRDMLGRVRSWAADHSSSLLVAARSDHGSAPFALLPDILRWASKDRN